MITLARLSLIEFLNQFLKLVKLLLNDEPRVWQIYDDHGEGKWYVYDPLCDQSAWFNTEEEVKIWLDER